MESVLHIQPVTREIDRPLLIGHSSYISVGEMSFKDEEEPSGEHAVQMRIGYPLEQIDHGSKRSHVPLYKSFECMPDTGRPGKQIFLETIHYLKDQRYLIPVRSKIQSGVSQGVRISHLPSIDYIRNDIGGKQPTVTDNRSAIVAELFERDGALQSLHSKPITNWIHDELIPHLDSSQVVSGLFDARKIERKMDRFRSSVINAPYDISAYHVKDVMRQLSIEHESYPVSYFSKGVVHHRLDDLERLCVPHGLDLRSHGKLKINSLARVDYNPESFQTVCDIMDNVPLTDFNIDLILEPDGEVSFYHEHFAVHRLACLEDHDLGAYDSESLLNTLINSQTLTDIKRTFLRHHTHMTENLVDVIWHSPIKMKLIKTIEDEACILIYESNSSSKAEPLCGVYFDIALQSISPITISPTINGF